VGQDRISPVLTRRPTARRDIKAPRRILFELAMLSGTDRKVLLFNWISDAFASILCRKGSFI
jgi:hypothetical protein